MLFVRGAEKPTDVRSWAMLGNNWPDDASIASLEAMVNDYRGAHAATVERVSVLESARDAIARSMVGEDFEAMHERMTKLVRDRNSIADGIETLVKYGDKMVDLCYETQKELAAACKKYGELAQECSDAGDEPGASAALASGIAACQDIADEAASQATTWGTEMKAAMPVITPATWGTPPAAPGPPTPESGGPTIQQTGLFGGIKQEGGPDGGGPGRVAPNSNSDNAQSNNGDSSNSNDPGQGKPDPNAHQGSGDGSGQHHGHHGNADPAANNGAVTPPGSSSLASAGMSSLPSPSGAGGTGLGSSGSGLGGLSSMGMGGMNPAGIQGASSPGGLGAPPPPMLSAPGGAGVGSGGGGSGAGSGVSGLSSTPSVPVAPVSAAPPVSATPSAAPSASAGAFSANPAAVQPMSPASSSGGGTGSAGSGPVAMAPLGGSSAGAPPPPAQVGAAPTASPGLSQGSIGPAASSAAAAGNVSSAASGMSVAPASFIDDGPSKVNAHAQMAVSTVKALIPGVSSYPGLAVAAAVVKVPGGIPQVVIATNEGEGYLPEGCFLPPGVIHAFVEMDSVEFDLKWLGWVDPARTLIDYVVTYEQRGESVDLLGLASSVAVSDEVKAMFPEVVPKVAPDAGAKPLGPQRGRNRHRLQVLAPAFYDQLQRLPESQKERVAALATRHAMGQRVAAFLSAPGGPWHLLSQLGTDPTDEQWALFQEDYDQRTRIVGAMRPGFLAAGRNDELNSRYQEAYQQLRAMETLLGWRSTADASLEDIIYAAHQTGIDISPLLLESADR